MTRTIAKRPTAKVIAEGLTVPERIMLFCIAFVPLWQRAPLAPSLTRELFVSGLIDREGTNSYTLTDQGRAVLAASFHRRIIAAPSKSSRHKCKRPHRDQAHEQQAGRQRIQGHGSPASRNQPR